MRLPAAFLAFLPSLFVLISKCTNQRPERQWPYNLPSRIKYFPEDEALVRRETVAEKRIQEQPPRGVRKMSFDEGEKFFLDYWSFETSFNSSRTESEDPRDFEELPGHDDTTLPFLQPPFSVHLSHQATQKLAILPRLVQYPDLGSLFVKRDYACPSGTSNCASIDRPNSCCPVGETCQIVQGNALGDVGCCADGQTCLGSVSQCQNGYTSCPNNPGGGCCVPGYQCDAIGCT